jgi:hypothetical protein
MHGKVEGDQIRVAYGVQGEFFHGEVGAGDLVSVGAQARSWRSQPERLPAKLVGGHQQYTHGFCVSLAQWRQVRRKARECLHNISHYTCLDQ